MKRRSTNGTRAPSFTGQTYPLPDPKPDWAEHHLTRQAQRVGPYPDTSSRQPSTLTRAQPIPGNRSEPDHRDPEAGTSTTPTRNGPGRPHPTTRAGRARSRGPRARGAQAGGARRLRAPAAAPNLADSPARRIVGRRVPGPPPGEPTVPRPPACASSRTSIASTRSVPPTSLTVPPSCRASTPPTTRSWRCWTAPGSCRAR